MALHASRWEYQWPKQKYSRRSISSTCTELYQIEIDDSGEEEQELLCQDPLDDSGAEHKYDFIVVDEGIMCLKEGAGE